MDAEVAGLVDQPPHVALDAPGLARLPEQVRRIRMRLRLSLGPIRHDDVRGLRRLFDGLPVRVVHHTQIFPGYDNVVARAPALGRALRAVTYLLEHTPLRTFGLSHLLVVETTDS